MSFLRGVGLPELLIVLAIVILLFGVGRIGKIAGELGKGIRSFKDGLSSGKNDEKEAESPEKKPDEK
jgi:sec-independent protein translocase protein TatA